MIGLQGKVIVVTGGFGTLGRAVADAAITAGAKLALVDLAAVPDHASITEDKAGSEFPGIDLQDEDAVETVLAEIASRFGRIDGVANVAGGFAWQTIAESRSATWEALHGQNLRTALNVSRAAIRHFPGGSGAIVNIGALGAQAAVAGMAAYAASKSGVHRLTEAMADEFKHTGMRVNAVLPSIIDTPANRAAMPDADFSAWIAPADLAQVILFLLSDASRAVNGALLPVRGRS